MIEGDKHMYANMKEPDQHISKDAIRVWRISNCIIHISFILMAIILLILDNHFDWYNWVTYVLWIVLTLDIITAIWSIFFEPVLLQKYWRYGVDEAYVKLRHGKWHIHNQVIPMTKVQYVGLEQGPLLRKYNLYTISIGTMASTHQIPALSEQEAISLRNQIATLARIKEVEY